MEAKAPRGTFDILPTEIYKWQHIEREISKLAEIYGYQEIRTPIFEHTELFIRGVGETTDIVSKEMYTFSDRSKRSLTLRPEGTASSVRALIEHKLFAGTLPVKWHYFGQMFRYDRPQAGRYRQFHQFGVEAFGSDDSHLDAEIICLLRDIIMALGIKGFEIHINSVGCPECRVKYRRALLEFFEPFKEELCNNCNSRLAQNPLRVLDCKEEKCRQLLHGHPRLFDYLCSKCSEHFASVNTALNLLQVDCIQDHGLVRGLDYYTNTAFEVIIPGIGAQSAVGGGGRYNGLVNDCGGPNLPGIGFAMGLERILIAMEHSGTIIPKPDLGLVFIIPTSKQWENQALYLTNELRKAGIHADKEYTNRSFKAQMKYAGKIDARAVVFIGDEEMAGGYYNLKDMLSGEQEQVVPEHIVDRIIKMVALK